MTDETTATNIGYADAMVELDEILAELDDDGIDIDVLSERVERAAELIAVCRSRITAAQERVSGIVDSLDTNGNSPIQET
jgi:exodeoxyribonuclease VII small subunit